MAGEPPKLWRRPMREAPAPPPSENLLEIRPGVGRRPHRSANIYGTPDPLVVDALWAAWGALAERRSALEGELAAIRRRECETVAALLAQGLTTRRVGARIGRSHTRVVEMATQANRSATNQ